jgi:hypothetical protein
MKRRVLFIIDSDPRTSHRPAEAVRIAAGIAVWKEVEVSLYFHGAAALALTDEAETLVHGDSFARHLTLFRDAQGHLISGEDQLAEWTAGQTTVARF